MQKWLILLLAASLCAEEPDLAKISEAMGHLIGKNLQSMGVPLDIDALVKGMKNSMDGKDSNLSEDDCMQALAELQEETLVIQAEKNLNQANEFLSQNATQEGVVSLEEGKIQYKIDKPGQGEAVQIYNSPVVRFHGRTLEGKPFGSSVGDEVITLDEAIAGFGKGILGMKEGEVRTLYIHPELGYGKNVSMPNALLIFEVELVRADVSADSQAAARAEDSEVTPLR